jgi:hypothetical protein
VRRDLAAGGPLLYRYPPGQDGLPGTEGAFLPCSFWLVQALATRGDQLQEPQLPRQLPQALTHAALVQAALAIRDAHPD